MHNIVAYIYDVENSYEQLVLAWYKLLLFPFRAILSLIALDFSLLCVYSARFTMTFTGRITQTDHDVFVTETYPAPIIERGIWNNICFNHPCSLFGILPLYRKEYGCSSWLTKEGDMVVYLPDIGKLDRKMNREKFLLTTKQSEGEFQYSELLKYSGC